MKILIFIKKLKKELVFLRDLLNQYFTKLHNNIIGESKSNVDEHSKLPWILFFSTVIFYLFYQLLLDFDWMTSGEMLSDNYYYDAKMGTFYQKFFRIDAGYIPFLTRSLSVIGNIFFNAKAIAFFYLWCPIILSATLIGTFCLAPFRKLVANDYLRFFCGILLLTTIDFETKTFINFSYSFTFFISIITALAFADRKNDVPKFAWILPFLISKPATLCTLPIMILVAFGSKIRFRWITFVSTIVGIVQIQSLIEWKKKGVLPNFNNESVTFFQKILGTVEYFLQFLFLYSAGPRVWKNSSKHFYSITLAGILIFLFCIYRIYKSKGRENSLIIVGFSIIFCAILINCFAMSNQWIPVSPNIVSYFYRYTLAISFGYFLILIGLITSFTKNLDDNPKKIYLCISPIILLSWFIIIGWAHKAVNLTYPSKNIPTHRNHSEWQNMAEEIDSDVQSICVPINDFGTIYRRGNCDILSFIRDNIYFKEAIQSKNGFSIKVPVPKEVKQNELVSFSLLVKSFDEKTIDIKAQATVISKNGAEIKLLGEKTLKPNGSIFFAAKKETKIKEADIIIINFDHPVKVGFYEQNNMAAIMWLGYKTTK